MKSWLRKKGEGTIIDKGQRIIGVIIENEIFNTMFKFNDFSYTFKMRSRTEKSLIDYMGYFTRTTRKQKGEKDK